MSNVYNIFELDDLEIDLDNFTYLEGQGWRVET